MVSKFFKPLVGIRWLNWEIECLFYHDLPIEITKIKLHETCMTQQKCKSKLKCSTPRITYGEMIQHNYLNIYI